MRRAAPLSAGVLPFVLLALPASAAAGQPGLPPAVRCGTMERLDRALLVPARRRARILHPPAAGKTTRDSFGGWAHLRESDNFAVKWTSDDIGDADAGVAVATLEESWSRYIGGLAQDLPTGADQFRVNAYVVGPNDALSIDFTGGYTDLDSEGYPYVVMSADLFAPSADRDAVRHVLSHEFYHAVQFATGAFAGQEARWYWESTAEWASQEVYPDLPDGYDLIGAFALTSELAVFDGADPLMRSLSSYHQYGVSVFFRYLVERSQSSTLVADSWRSAGAQDDPLDVVGGLLPDGDVAAAYREFAPHTALWDFAHRDLILTAVQSWTRNDPGVGRFVAGVGHSGTGGWTTIRDDRLPRAFGTNVVEMVRPDSGQLELSVEVEPAGSLGTPSTAQVTLVRESGAGITYTPIALTGGAGAATASLPEGEERAYLVVAATADTRSTEEIFPYRFWVGRAVQPEPQPSADPDGEGGGCAVGGRSGRGSTAGALAALLMLLARAGLGASSTPAGLRRGPRTEGSRPPSR